MAEAQERTALVRQLKIKTGVVKRTQKEYSMYFKEKEDQEAKIQKMRDASADSHDIKKQQEVLTETTTMIPDTRGRLETGLGDLQALVADEATQALGGAPELAEATTVIAACEAMLSAV